MAVDKINNNFWLTETVPVGPLSFPDFFNKFNAGKKHWGIKTNGDTHSLRCKDPSLSNSNLKKIFTQSNMKSVTGKDDFNIYQFLIMSSIMINETGGTFILATGEKGSAEYFFNAKAGTKVSYNCTPPKVNGKYQKNTGCGVLGNKTAYDLFHDPVFMNVPARASMYKPKNINDTAWSGQKYPSGEPTGFSNYKPGELEKSYNALGIIADCDFFKFRGRGVIQLTGRGNYVKFLEYIKNNKSVIAMQPKTLTIVNNWGNDSGDTVATKITNRELDTIFEDDACAILVFKTHSSNAALVKMYSVSNPNEFIDLAAAYGKAIGGDKYATHFTNRVFEIVEKIPDWLSKQTA
jgi:hypothetical protein